MTDTPANISAAVILCGGQGTRMGSLTEEVPKSLLDVQGRPILWYIISRLYLSGVSRFVLPVGYLGEQIASYVETAFGDTDCEIICVDTGADTPIGQRIDRVRGQLPDDGDIFLTNGDALFDFDAADIAAHHVHTNAAITFATVQTISKYGLVVVDGDGIVGFERQSRVAGYQIEGERNLNTGLIYAGICMLHTRAFDVIDLGASQRFESELFPKLIADESAAQYVLPGFWYSIDTPKDLAAVNIGDGSDPLFAGPASRLKADLDTAMQGPDR
jgi:glucose-1-phosphate cytidylyltransferase